MKDFLRLISFLIATTGCLAVGAVLALKGASLLTIATRAGITLAALWIAMRLLTALLIVVINYEPKADSLDVEEAETDTLMAEAS